jgi:hypothetical protein
MTRTKPVSRMDTKKFNGWLARIYRAGKELRRTFADSAYNGRDTAKQVANSWVVIAEGIVPRIDPKPVLQKATVTLREDLKNRGSRYYDVYIGKSPDHADWSEKFYFSTFDEQFGPRISTIEKRATLDQAAALDRANDLKNKRNAELQEQHRQALEKWYVEWDKVEEAWERVKTLDLWVTAS